jgi:hypothetical protein
VIFSAVRFYAVLLDEFFFDCHAFFAASTIAEPCWSAFAFQMTFKSFEAPRLKRDCNFKWCANALPDPIAPEKQVDVVEQIDHEPEQRKSVTRRPTLRRSI